MMRNCQRLDDHIELALGFRCGHWRITPNQVRSEIRALLQILEQRPPCRVLEIGTSLGGSLYLLSRVCAPGARLISIDLPAHHAPLRSVLLRSLAAPGQEVLLLSGDSQRPAMRDRVQQALGPDRLDVLFVDGDHSYEGCRRDLELYWPLVQPGGLVVLHDIVPGPSQRVGGVPRVWQEIKDAYPFQELVEDWHQGGFGIGLIWPAGDPPPRPVSETR
jgi:predicted O-methyltransferase YrrM